MKNVMFIKGVCNLEDIVNSDSPRRGTDASMWKWSGYSCKLGNAYVKITVVLIGSKSQKPKFSWGELGLALCNILTYNIFKVHVMLALQLTLTGL